jgi:triosephosphate isomerase
MVAELCGYVILGHSERRAYFGDTDESINRKVLAAQGHDLTPIVCVGETLSQYEAGETAAVVGEQVREGLRGLEPAFASRLIVAYEPVWAIGTGRASSGEQAVHQNVVRRDLLNYSGWRQPPRLYGGSVTGSNAASSSRSPILTGRSSGGQLKKDDFSPSRAAAADAMLAQFNGLLLLRRCSCHCYCSNTSRRNTGRVP